MHLIHNIWFYFKTSSSPFAKFERFGRLYSLPGNSNRTWICSEAADFFLLLDFAEDEEVAESKRSSPNWSSSFWGTKLLWRGLRNESDRLWKSEGNYFGSYFLNRHFEEKSWFLFIFSPPHMWGEKLASKSAFKVKISVWISSYSICSGWRKSMTSVSSLASSK